MTGRGTDSPGTRAASAQGPAEAKPQGHRSIFPQVFCFDEQVQASAPAGRDGEQEGQDVSGEHLRMRGSARAQ